MNGRWGPRWRGAAAGLVPWLPIVILFVVSDSAATPAGVAGSLATVAAITIGAGWLAGPLASGPERRLVVGGLGYAIAAVVVTVAIGTIQGAVETIESGTDPITLVSLSIARAAYGAIYLILPVIALGLAWSVAAWGLSRNRRFRGDGSAEQRRERKVRICNLREPGSRPRTPTPR